MRVGSCIALSVVACNLLVGAEYADWSNTSFKGGDIVTITSNGGQPPNSILSKSITIADGILTANITSNNVASCGSVGCFTSGATIGGGGKVDFTLSTNSLNSPAFGIQKGGNLTISSGFSLRSNSAISALFLLTGGTLSVTSDFSLSGGKTAIDAKNSSTLTLKSANGKSVSIQGDIKFDSSTANITLQGSNQKITGNIIGGNAGKLTLDVKGGGTITGNVSNNGVTSIALSNSGRIAGNVEIKGSAPTLSMNNGHIDGSLTSMTAKNALVMEARSSIGREVKFEGENNTLILKGGSSVSGQVKLTGGGENTLSVTGSSRVGSVELKGRTNKIDVDNSTINGGITSEQDTELKVINGGKVTGNVSITGNKFDATLTNGSIGGSINSSSTTNTITANQSSSIGSHLSLSGQSNNVLLQGGSNVGGNLSTLGNINVVKVDGSIIKGNYQSNKETDLDIINNGKILGSVSIEGSKFDASLDNGHIGGNLSSIATNNNLALNNASTIGGKVTTLGQNNIIEVKNNSVIEGGLKSTNKTTITLESGGRINGLADVNGTDFTLNLINGVIKGNLLAQASNSNTINLDRNASITGKVTTNGNTNKITAQNNSNILGGIENKKGDFNLEFNDSKIVGGVISRGGNTEILLKGSSSLEGDTKLYATNSKAYIQNSSSVVGNMIFAGTNNILEAKDSSSIKGIVVANNGTSDFDFKNGATLEGGINTNAGVSTIDFAGSSKIYNGTSNFSAKTTIAFKDSAQADNETFNIRGNETNFSFSDQSSLRDGSINNLGGKLQLTFDKNSEMKNSSIVTQTGETKLEARDDAKLHNAITQSGGTIDVDFSDRASFEGNITQTGGKSTIDFKASSMMEGDFEQSGADSDSVIKFDNNAHIKGNITTHNGRTNIVFTGTSYIEGDIKVGGFKNTVTFTDGTKLDGNLTLDGEGGSIDGQSKGTFTGSHITGNVQGYDEVELILTRTQVDGFLHQGGSFSQKAMNAKIESSLIKGGFKGYGESNNVIEMNVSQIENGVKQDTGSLTLTADQSVITGGFEGTNNSINKITMTEGRLEDGILQDTGKLDFKSTNTAVTGGFFGRDSDNTINTLNGSIDGGIKQSSGTLVMTNQDTKITGGFLGDRNSLNKVTMTGGHLYGGIVQDTGKFDLFSNQTDFEGGFKGIDSENTMQVLRGNFYEGDITQIRGTLKAEIVGLENVRDFLGESSENIVHLSNTKVRNVTQDRGSLEFLTNALVDGNISGTNASENQITIIGADVRGNVSQDRGSMRLEFTNSTVHRGVSADEAIFGIYANHAGVKEGITLTSSITEGNSSSFTLEGEFRQIQGTSNLVFTDTKFLGLTSLINTQSATLIFSHYEIQNMIAQNGTNTISLTNGKMGTFDGSMGRHSIALVSSISGALRQSGGFLNISGANSSKIDSITGTNSSTLTISLDRSEVLGDVTNNGNTTISMQDARIGGNVIQRNNTMNFNAINSKVEGSYQQFGGKINPLSLTNSQIHRGIHVERVESGTMTFNRDSQVMQGLKSIDSNINFTILNKSKISGDTQVKGLTQSGGVVTGTLNQASEIQNGIDLENGVTRLTLFNKSKIFGDITAINNETTILVDDSEIEGNITVNGKFLHLTAQNNSTIKSPQMKVTDADLKLIVDTNSKFIGDLAQVGKNQEVIIKQESVFDGSITNTDTTGTIMINNATLTGSITQNGGKLGIDISNKGIVGGDITLENANVNISGSGEDNHIKGKFTQNGGTLTGAMNSLTLGGTYTQAGGTSEVSFTNSHFKSDATITNAISSSLTFIKSTLKNYTISGGENNTLKLLDGTIMTGNLTLANEAKALLKMENSTIDGNIVGSGDSELRFNTINSTITGNVDFDTGGITGQTDNTKINGDITLKDTHSDISFAKGSVVGGNLSTENGDNTIKFNASSIEGNITANGGIINLELSNGSKVGQNVMLVDTKAHLSGDPRDNEILGNFTTKGTTSRSTSLLNGDISSLTLHGTFTQEFGESNINFRHNSLFKGQVIIKEANSAHLKFIGESGIRNTVQIIGGANNQIDLTQNSFIEGDITTQIKSTTTINAQNQSFIVGNIAAENALKTSLLLNSSTFAGNISQTNGDFYLRATNSKMTSSVTEVPYGLIFSNVKADAEIVGSTYETSINAIDSTLQISLKDQSNLNFAQTPQPALLQNSSLKITSSTSNVGLNLVQNSNNGNHTLDFVFANSSIYSGRIDLENIKSSILFDDSKLISPEMKITQGSLELIFKNAKHETHLEENPELIQVFEASDTAIKITTQDQSHAKIAKADFINTELTIDSSETSRFEGDLFTLKEGSNVTYKASSNGNINVNTLIDGNTNTLKVELHGGLLQGSIVQDNFITGDVELKGEEGLGGRWAVSDDSRVRTLEIQNHDEAFEGGAIFKSSFDTPITLVDFTLNFDDHDKSSRMGKEMVQRPDPLEDGTIPPPQAHQTYARTLFVDELSGNNGFFRVYADLGTSLADKVVANKASGDHVIQVNYRSDTFKEGGRGDRIVVARVEDPNTKVSFKGTQSEIGLKKYDTEIIKENAQGGLGFEWIIGQVTPSGLSNSSKIIASILQSQYRTFALETDSLDRRLGGLENIQRDSGFWVRSFIGQASKDATDYSTSATDKYYSIWSGVDYNARGLTGHNFLGVFFNYTGINTESNDYIGNSSNFAFGFYNVFKAHSGFYFDLLAKYIYTSSEFEISNYSLAKNHPKISNHKFLANFEMGYTFYLGEKRKSLYIEPQFQITSGYIQGFSTSFVDVGGEKIWASIGHNAPALMRLGTFVGREFGEKISANIKAGTSIAYDVNSGGELNFKDSSNVFKRAQGGDFRMLLSAHADFKFGDTLRLYTSFDTSFFGSYNTVFNVNLGLRFVFGKRNNVVSEVPMVYNPYEPTPPPSDDRRTVPMIKGFTTKDIDTNYRGKKREIPSYNQRGVGSPIQGYTPQPMMRKNYRDAVNIINPNSGWNQ